MAASNRNASWGLTVPGRPATPSEGHAQSYQRIGPIDRQVKKAFQNGTTLTFGPHDLVDEFHPMDHPFVNQIAVIDTAVRDCKAARDPYQRHGPSNPFDNFRETGYDISVLPHHTLDSGVYVQSPSVHAHCGSLISVYSTTNKSDIPGAAHPGLSQDKRFGVMERPASATLPRRGGHGERGGRGEGGQRGGRGDSGGRGGRGGHGQAGDRGGRGHSGQRGQGSDRGGRGGRGSRGERRGKSANRPGRGERTAARENRLALELFAEAQVTQETRPLPPHNSNLPALSVGDQHFANSRRGRRAFREALNEQALEQQQLRADLLSPPRLGQSFQFNEYAQSVDGESIQERPNYDMTRLVEQLEEERLQAFQNRLTAGGSHQQHRRRSSSRNSVRLDMERDRSRF